MVPACLSELKDQPYHVWLDNLFISHKLLAYLRKHDWGAAGTARANSGMLQKLIELKKEEKRKDIYPWGRLFSGISDDNLVMQFAWKDNSLCLFQSTIHTGFEPEVVRARKRPSKTSTKAKTAQASFWQWCSKRSTSTIFYWWVQSQHESCWPSWPSTLILWYKLAVPSTTTRLESAILVFV